MTENADNDDMTSAPKPAYAPRRRKMSWLARIGVPLICLLGFLVVAAVGFKWTQPNLNWLDALYTAMLTVATVNNSISGREMTPESQIWSMIVLAGGILIMVILGAQIAAFVVELEIRRVFGRRHMQKRIDRLKGHMIVCGLGHTGLDVAQQLAQAGKELLIVDQADERIAVAERNGWLHLQGNVTEEDVLESLNLSRAGALFACLGSDAENLFVCLSAKQENPNLQIVSLAREETSIRKLKRAGADRVICPQQIGATQMADVVLRPAMVDFLEIAHSGVDLEMDRLILREGHTMVGQTLEQLSLPKKHGVHVVAIRSASGQTDYQPTAMRTLQVGDQLILVGPKGAAETLQHTD